jgi:hypothetical protein
MGHQLPLVADCCRCQSTGLNPRQTLDRAFVKDASDGRSLTQNMLQCKIAVYARSSYVFEPDLLRNRRR